MKNLLCLFLLVAVAACSKKQEEAPAADLATQVAGIYQVNRISIDGNTLNLPTSTASGNVVISKTDPTQVGLVVSITNGNTTTKYPYTATLTRTGSTVNLAMALVADPNATKSSATVDGNKLVITETQAGYSGVFEATKQ